jgi:hypothetical protein
MGELDYQSVTIPLVFIVELSPMLIFGIRDPFDAEDIETIGVQREFGKVLKRRHLKAVGRVNLVIKKIEVDGEMPESHWQVPKVLSHIFKLPFLHDESSFLLRISGETCRLTGQSVFRLDRPLRHLSHYGRQETED